MYIINPYRFAASAIDIRDYTGVEVTQQRGAFYDVDGFANMTGSGDYTFIAWFDSTTGNPLLYGQGSSFSADRLTILGARMYSLTTTDTWTTKTGLGGIVITRNAGVTKATYTQTLSVTTKTLTAMPNVGSPSLKMFGSDYQLSPILNPTGDTILAIQYLDSAMSDSDAVDLLEAFTIHESPTEEYLFFQKTDGATDNGGYPAKMSGYSSPSPYVISTSFDKPSEDAWKAFDLNYNTRTILQDSGGTVSAGAWLKIDLGASNAQACDGYLFRSWASQGANSFTVAGSNDDSSYTDLYTGAGTTSNSVIQKHTWTNSTTYRYYRITCNTGFNSSQWTSYFHFLYDQSKEWTSGGGCAPDGIFTFPT